MADAVPTTRELEALKVLWRRGQQGPYAMTIYGELEPRDGELAYTTALSLLQTMEQKGLVGHESAGKAYALLRQGPGATACSAISRAGFLDYRCSTARWASTVGPCPPVAPAELGRTGRAGGDDRRGQAHVPGSRDDEKGGSDETLVRDDQATGLWTITPSRRWSWSRRSWSSAGLRQPVRRLSVARSAVVGLAMLAVLAALPGWPRACWLGRPGRTQPDRETVAAVSGQDSGITTPAQLGARPEPRDAMPTGPSLLARRQENSRAGRESIQPAVGTSVRIPTVDWTSDWPNLVGGAFLAGGALVLASGSGSACSGRRYRHPAPNRDSRAAIVTRCAGTRRRLRRQGRAGPARSPAMGGPARRGRLCCRPAIHPPASGSSRTSRDAGATGQQGAAIRIGDTSATGTSGGSCSWGS